MGAFGLPSYHKNGDLSRVGGGSILDHTRLAIVKHVKSVARAFALTDDGVASLTGAMIQAKVAWKYARGSILPACMLQS